MKRSVNQLKIGAILSYTQIAISIIVNLLYTPVMIRLLGRSEFGLYNLAASTISMLSLLSLGFNSGYIKYFAAYKKDENEDGIAKLNGLFLTIFLVIGLIALICGLFLSFNLTIVFDEGLTASEFERARILMVLLTFNLAISFPMSVFQAIISANEKFIFLKGLTAIKTVVGPLVTLPVLLMGYRSIAMVCVSIGISMIVDAIYVIYAKRTLHSHFVFHDFESGLFKDLFIYTSFIAINIIVDQINWNIDKVLLGRFSGTASVAVYSVGFILYNCYQNFSISISGVFTPRIHGIVNTYKDQLELRDRNLTDLFVRTGRIQFLILALIASGLCVFGQPFIHFWSGDGYENAYYVALLLIVPALIPLTQSVGIEIQRAENLHQFRSIVYLIMAMMNLALSIFLCQLYGEVGAAIGTAVSLVIANGFIMNFYYYKKCGINIPVFWKNILNQSRGLVAPIVVGYVIHRFVVFDNIIELCLGIIIYTVIYCISMWILGMNQYEKDLVLGPARRLFEQKR